MTVLAQRAISPAMAVWLLLAAMTTALPHFFRLPPPLLAVIAGALTLRGLLLWRGKLDYPRWLLWLLVVASTGLVLMFYASINGREPGSALLIAMLALKLCESKTYRDGMISLFLAYFVAAINFLFTQNIPTALWMLVQVVLITYALITLQRVGAPAVPARQRLRTASVVVVQALPLMLILFLLFPRIPGPLWGLPSETESAQTGFSDSMSPGSFAQLALSGAVAFRVRFDDEPPKPDKLYWRGRVLWEYDGRTWRGRELARQRAPVFRYRGDEVSYQVTLEPHSEKSVFGLDMPGKFDNVDRYDADYQLSMRRDVSQVMRYSVTSYPEYQINAELPPDQRRLGLGLPRNGNPQARQLGERLRREHGGDHQAIGEALLRRFREQAYFYTLQPPLLGRDGVDDFLFESRRGFCEHYASAFTFVMRAAGVPARVVVGYLGGEMNPYDNFMTVRQSDAHAWAEIWLEGEGWVRVDPTGAVAPSRIEEGVESSLSEGDELPFQRRRGGPLKSLVDAWDAVDNAWNQWVLGYGPEVQRQFLSRFGLGSLADFVIAMVVGFTVIMGLVALWILRPGLRRRPATIAEREYRRFCRAMARQGLARRDHEGAESYTSRLAEALPGDRRLLLALGKSYSRLLYREYDEALAERFVEASRRARKIRRPDGGRR
ncbi:MAG: transglutaminase TgpA family protein [Pseudomonadota bacterium]